MLFRSGIGILLLLFLAVTPAFAAGEEEKDKEMSVEEFLQILSTVRNVLDRRDPFQDNNPSYIKEEKAAPVEEARVETSSDDLPPLERHPVESYIVKAILLGDKSPRALVKIPEGSTVIMEEGMKLGDKNGVVNRIDKFGIKVMEKIKNNFGSFDDVTQQLPVGGTRDESGAKK